MKTTGLLALLSLLLTIAFNQVAGMPREEARAALESGDPLPALISEYVFLHQTRYESVPVHAMAGVKSCPE